jgi:CRISPR-associated endonuclease/helicase Cas3
LFKDKLCKDWDNKHKKYSHKGKTLAKHINEVKGAVKSFLNFYGDFPEISFEVADYLAEYHDYGKLCKEWTLNQKRPPPHSPWSFQWIKENGKIFEPKELTYVLFYFILKHHSKLNTAIGIREYSPIIDFLNSLIPKIDFEKRINLVDTFGLFKIADILSASNKSFNPKNPPINIGKVKRIIGDRIDDDRWRQQLELQRIGNIGILRAYTGWGKTTASLLFFANKKSMRKVFYLLPTITAINKFHQKLSGSFPNDVSKYFYFYDAEIREDQEKLNELFFAKNFLAPLVITTIDQFLLSFLQYGRYPTKRVMFRGTGLIFDEVHLLNPLMLALTTYFLRKYASIYKIDALFMSATLPDALSKYLLGELTIPQDHFIDYSKEYYQRKRVMLTYEKNNPIENDVDKMIEFIEKERKVLVIVNTVSKAIEIAKILEEHSFPKNRTILLHSRFMFKDRKRKEEEIDEKRKAHILISTQISEVSLDISYHTLFTEISSLPSMVQRFGRVNRYGTQGIQVNHVNTYLYEPTISNKLHYPYSPTELNLARKLINEVEGEKLKSEGQLLDIFNSEYSYDDLMKEIDEVNNRVDLEAFEKSLNFFFSLDAKEERLMKILSYRDSFNALVIPDPNCIGNDNLKEHMKNILFQPLREMNFENKRRRVAKIKSITLPVPIWLLRQEKNIREDLPYPVISFKNRIYDEYFGLVESDIA